MGTCGQPGYVFRDFCLKQGIDFIIFCLNQGVDFINFCLKQGIFSWTINSLRMQNLVCLLIIFADQVFIDPTFFGIFVCGPLQSSLVNVCTLLIFGL